jgi:hypothetical protein
MFSMLTILFTLIIAAGILFLPDSTPPKKPLFGNNLLMILEEWGPPDQVIFMDDQRGRVMRWKHMYVGIRWEKDKYYLAGIFYDSVTAREQSLKTIKAFILYLLEEDIERQKNKLLRKRAV